ncbi:hypothetical protein [Streptomyces zaomyceticus]|uniref:hypothetical protein n=1 Tax=Streptomyces zaomyceticus TaxID=68286 RepID=UPI002E1AD974
MFEISAKELDGTSSFDFRSIPEWSAVLVNVSAVLAAVGAAILVLTRRRRASAARR